MRELRYVLYARKSSEDDRQLRSIPEQIAELERLIKRDGLKVKKRFSDEKTAKKSGQRKGFDEMIDYLISGEADAILCWELHRLSRNPRESGVLQEMLQNGEIKEIRTMTRRFLPNDNALLFGIEAGSANQYILDLRKHAIRAKNSHLDRGYYPGYAPLGYINTKHLDKGTNHVKQDEDRWDMVQELWRLALTSQYTMAQLWRIARDDMKLTTKAGRKSSSKPVSRSCIYGIFSNVFYTGKMRYGGQLYEGKHKAMITMAEFERAQQILRPNHSTTRHKQYDFALRGPLFCGECGCMITAEQKNKSLKNGSIAVYIYYRCTNRKPNYRCQQKGSVREEEFFEQVETELSKYTIMPEFQEWALETLRENNEEEISKRKQRSHIMQKRLTDAHNNMDELTRMRYRKLLDDDEYLEERNKLKVNIASINEEIEQIEQDADIWLDRADRVFDFAVYAKEAFKIGDFDTKRAILSALGSKPVVIGGKIQFSSVKWLEPIRIGYKPLEDLYLTFEPKFRDELTGVIYEKTPAFADVRSSWLPIVVTELLQGSEDTKRDK